MKRVLLVIAAALVGSSFWPGRSTPSVETRTPPRAPRAAAPIDLTGYWVSIVTQDWRWRMVTPSERRLPGPSLDPRGRKGCRRLGSGER